MKTVQVICAALSLAMASNEAIAHSMSPGYQKKFAPGVVSLVYEVKNNYEFPATFAIQVFDKSGRNLEKDWKADHSEFKLFAGQSKKVRVKFRLANVNDRKVLVCSVLEKIGYSDEVPSTISRVCSRLWLFR